MDDEYFEKFGYPPFYADKRMYEMTEKRNYKEILVSVETSLSYINNHLGNIDGHLEKINTTNLNQEVKIARNKDRIGLICKIGGVLLTLLGGSLAFILHLLGIY